MAPRYFIIISIFCFSFPSLAQDNNYESIHANNVKTWMSTRGPIYQNPDWNSGFQYTADPNFEEQGTILFNFFNVAAKASNNTIGFPINSSAFMGISSIKPGPFDPTNPSFDYNRIWKVKKSEIMSFLDDLSDGTINFPIPAGVLNWPGRSNTIHNGAFTDKNYADFFDANSDGKYNPVDGDYPVLKLNGNMVIPEEMLYSSWHRIGDTGITDDISLEVHALMYAFKENENDDPLNNTVFSKYKIFNKSDIDYDQFKFGLMTDFDLGCFIDDYAGSIPELNAYYAYNKTNVDSTNDISACQDEHVFLENPPVQSIYFLNKELHSLVTIFNNIGSPPSGVTDPDFGEEYFRILDGFWKDGTPITNSNFGYNPDSTNLEITKHSYHGDPNETNDWHMISSPGFIDNRAVGSFDFGVFSANDVVVAEFATTYTRNPGASHIENINYMKEDIQEIQMRFNNGFPGQTTSIKEIENDVSYVFPNPSDGHIYIKTNERYEHFRLFNMHKKVIFSGQISNNQLDLSHLISGSYIIQLSKGTDSVLQRIVIAK